MHTFLAHQKGTGTYVRDRAPGRVVPFGVLVDPAVRTSIVGLDRPEFSALNDALSGLEGGLSLEILRDAPDKALGFVLGLILLNQGSAAGDIGAYGFLADNVLSCRKSLTHDVRLKGDRKDNDNRLDI